MEPKPSEVFERKREVGWYKMGTSLRLFECTLEILVTFFPKSSLLCLTSKQY